MPEKELFNQTQANISDNERLAFSSPGVEGAKNITWANFKNLLANFFMRLTGNQTVDGTKTFNASPIVPAPTLDNHAANRKFVLDEIANTGDVTGPASSVNNHIAVFDGTTGKVIKDSGISFIDIRGVVGTSIDSGLESTINAGDNTKIDVAAGRAIIANNYTNPTSPTITVIEKNSPTIAIPITNILTQDITYIGIDVNGEFIQSPTLWTEEQTRDIASISLIVHPDGIIGSITNVGIWNKDSLPSFNDLILTLGRYINKDGNVYSANGSNLNIDKSAGTAFSYGGNYGVNNKNPNIVSLGAETAINFILSKSQPGTFVRTQNVPNTQYEPGKDGNLVDLTDGYFVAHRIYLSVSTGETAMQYGQYQYDSQKKAVNSWDKEAFTKAPEYSNILLKGIIVIKKGTTDLTNEDDVKFINVGDFGDKALNEVSTFSRYGEPVELLDGLSDQRQNITLIEVAGTIYAEVERLDGGDMHYIFGQKEYILNCTTGPGTNGNARISLTAGASASSPTYNYVYVIRSGDVAILQSSTTRPTGEFAYVGVCLVPDAITFKNTGPYQFQRYSDAKEFDGRSSVQRTNERLRQLPGLYESGMEQTVTINTVPNPDTVDFSITSGKGWQKHLQDTPALQVSIDGIYIINHPTTPYLKITDLNDPEALQTADGTSLAGTRFNWVIWMSVNKNGFVKLYLNLPNGSYAIDQNAIDDPNQTAVTTIPKEYRGTGLLIARLPFRHRTQNSGEYINLAETLLSRYVIDLRGQIANVGAGGGLIPASTVFADDVFRIFDNANLWEMGFELSQLTANRTLTVPNVSATLSTVIDSLTFNPADIQLNAKESYYNAYAQSGALTITVPTNNYGQAASFLVQIDTDGSNITIPAWWGKIRNDYDNTSGKFGLMVIYDGALWQYSIYKIDPLTQLAAPVLNTPTMGNTTADLTWNQITNNSGYEVYYKLQADSNYILFETTAADTNSSQVTGLVSGNDYDFKVVTKGDGVTYSNSVDSNVVQGTTTTAVVRTDFTITTSENITKVGTNYESESNQWNLARGLCDEAIVLNDDVIIECTIDTDASNTMLGANTNNALDNYQDYDYGYFINTLFELKANENGAFGSVLKTVAPSANTRLALRRVSGIWTLEETTNGGQSYTVLHTFATNSQAEHYVKITGNNTLGGTTIKPSYTFGL